MTPLTLEILLWYWFNDTRDYLGIGLDFAYAEKSTQYLITSGMLLINDGDQPEGAPKYKVNKEKVDCYLEALCSLPLPVNKWVMPE